MGKMDVLILKYCLIFSFFSSLGFSQDNENNSKKVNNDSLSVVLLDNENIIYPGKPLVMSLVLPGAGQFYNKSPLWKTASFVGIEIATIFAWNHFNSEAEKYRQNYESFANEHWSLQNWATNHTTFPNQINNGRSWSTFSALTKLSGTHDLSLVITGQLSEELGLTKVSSDSLDTNPAWAFSEDVSVVKDRHFYENIGKYDQFLGGWNDASSDWYWEEKDVGDSLEIIIKTPKKQDYIDKRFKSNQMLNRVKYSITALMFNHVISGVESVFSSSKSYERKKEKVSSNSYHINLTYNPLNKSGVGGVSFAYQF